MCDLRVNPIVAVSFVRPTFGQCVKHIMDQFIAPDEGKHRHMHAINNLSLAVDDNVVILSAADNIL